MKCINCDKSGFLNKKDYQILNFKSEELSKIFKDMWKHGYKYTTNDLDFLIWSDNKQYYDNNNPSQVYEKYIIFYNRTNKKSNEEYGYGQTCFFSASSTTLIEIISKMSEWTAKIFCAGSMSFKRFMNNYYNNTIFSFLYNSK